MNFSRKRTTWLSLLLVLSLLLSVLPPLTANAQALLTIMNLSSLQENPTQQTSDTISVEVSVANATVDSSLINSMYYTVRNLNTGAYSEIRNNKAQPVGNSSFAVAFSNVKLSQGLNEIYVKYGDPNTVASAAAYVYFTATATISNLQFNGVNFVGGTTDLYPKNAPVAPYVSGSAPNARSITGYLVGNNTPIDAVIDTTGNFNMFLNRTGDSIRAGDNIFKIVSQNPTNTYNVDKTFVYDNGDAFAFRGRLAMGTPTVMTPLFRETPLTVASGPVTFDSYIKVPLVNNGGTTVTQYTYADVTVVGTIPATNTIRYDISALTEVPSLSVADRYRVYAIPNTTLQLADETKEQIITVNFLPTTNGIPVYTAYRFNFVDPNYPYVLSAADVQSPTLSIDLARNSVNTFTQQPKTLKIRTTGGTGAPSNVHVYMGDTLLPDPTVHLTDATGNEYHITLQNIPDGMYSLRLVPWRGPAGAATLPAARVEMNGGAISYQVNISSAPYFTPSNFSNGTTVNNTQFNGFDLNTTIGDFRDTGRDYSRGFYGRIFNVPNPTTTNIKAYLNGQALQPHDSVAPAGQRYRIMGSAATGYYVVVYMYNTPVLPDGRHTLRIDFLNDNNGVITSSNYDFFMFSQPTPSFQTVRPVEPDENTTNFVQRQSDDYYATSELQAALRGKFLNASTLTITLRRTNRDGTIATPITQTFTYAAGTNSWSSGSTTILDVAVANALVCEGMDNTLQNCRSTDFRTRLLPILAEGVVNGQTIYDFLISNSSGVTVQKSVTIAREPTPYKVVYPILLRDNRGKERASINSNFVEVMIIAEGADSVVFGKDEAVVRIDTDGLITGVTNTPYFYYLQQDMKAGNSSIKFTVNRGNQKTNGSFDVFNSGSSIEGASFIAPLGTNMKLFNGFAELKFEKNTQLMRNDPTASEKYLTTDRKLYFGLANVVDGRVDKMNRRSNTTDSQAQFWLREQSGRYRPASPYMLWIDAGSIGENDYQDTNRLREALYGMGSDPHNLTPTGALQKFYNRGTTVDIKNMVVPTKRGQLTLSYSPSIRADAWKYVTVMHFGIFENSNGVLSLGWRNIGGVVDEKKNTITVQIDSFGYYVPMYMFDSFDDVISHGWARNDLDILYSKGLMRNKTQGLFVPNDPITRGEFATILTKVFELPLDYEGPGTFIDVFRYNPSPLALYDYKFIETAARTGIVRGNAGGRFAPDSTITRQDAAVMIARAAEFKMSAADAKQLEALRKQFTDGDMIDIYARGAVEAVVKAGYIVGRENVLLQGEKKATYRFDPYDNFTRAEAAAVLIRVMKAQRKIPK